MQQQIRGFVLMVYVSFVLLLGLSSLPAFAAKITIPDATPITARSVEFWEKCSKNPSLNSCEETRDGSLNKITNKSFIEPPIKSFVQKLPSEGQSTDSQGTTVSSTQTPLPSIEERVLVGFTDFLVNRAKQEARLYLQEELTDNFCEYDKGKDIFPKTCQVFIQLKNAHYSMSATSVMLRTAIRDDFRNYPDRYFENKYSTKNDEKWLLARIAVAISGEARSSRDITEIIGGLANFNNPTLYICKTQDPKKNKEVCEKITNYATVFWTLSENLRQLRMHLGEKYENNKIAALHFAVAGTILDPNIPDNYKGQTIKSASRKLSNVVKLFETIQNYRQQIEKLEAQADPTKTNQTELTLRVRSTLIGINALSQISAALNTTKPSNLEDLQAAAELAQAIIEEDYSRILFETVAFAKDYSSATASSKYLPLMVELASAKSSEDIQNIFEVAAAPAGSYREKFNSDSLTSITALAGFAHTNERYGVDRSPKNYGWQPFLPVGVQQTWKVGGGKGRGAAGIFVSLVDVGTFAMSRQGDDTISNKSNIGLLQVFSPGIYGTYNLPFAHPIVFGVGVARTPKLAITNTGEEVSSTRIQAFLAFDLTLFSFR